MIKIAHLSSAHKDGDVRIFHKECVSLAEKGFDVSLIIPNTESRVDKGVNIISFEYFPKSRLKRMWKTVNLVYKKALELNATLYHIHDPELLRIAKKLKKRGKIVIYDAHEDLPRQILSKNYIPLFLRKIISRVTERFENKIVKKLDGVITATPFIKERFILVNKNVIDINNFPLINEIDINVDNKETIKKNKICFIGGISKIRGLFEVVKSIENLNIEFDLAGEIPSNLEEELKKIKGWDKVNKLGYIDRKTSLQLKSVCLAGIVTFYPEPNHINAQPNKIFEYMASGLPVIGSHFPLWKLIIEDNNCGLCVNPLEPEEISKAIIYIQNHPDEAKIMGENGKKMVIEKYNWNIEKEKLFKFYELILNDK